LALLSDSEQEAVLKYYHVKDAKMSLASHLLKHLVIAKYCSVPWSKSTISRGVNGKPCYLATADQPRIEFNVSHQAGLVTLIAVIGGDGTINVGTDIVCANERLSHDYKYIEKSGFFDWVDMHGEVFADSEINHMKLSSLGLDKIVPGKKLHGYGNDALSRCQWRNRQLDIVVLDSEENAEQLRIDSNKVIDAKLRRFYAMWCLRETYVKMTGEALLAPWLKELDICDVQSPIPPVVQDLNSLERGEIANSYCIKFKGREVTNVQMELTALGPHYMVGGAVRATKSDTKLEMGPWKELDLEEDVLQIAESMA
jgi:4'-phosphopantetheinyl transferase